MHENEKIIRNAYQIAEDQDVAGWIAAFTEDGTFTDESIPYTYRGEKELGLTVEVYAKAFPDMHRELHRFYVDGDTVIVQLHLQGTHTGPLELPSGTVPPTGKRMDAPCCDVFELVDGKIKRFDCYPSGTVALTQLGVLDDLSAAFGS
jgi:ketosteroid isomerase-like protein